MNGLGTIWKVPKSVGKYRIVRSSLGHYEVHRRIFGIWFSYKCFSPTIHNLLDLSVREKGITLIPYRSNAPIAFTNLSTAEEFVRRLTQKKDKPKKVEYKTVREYSKEGRKTF